MSTQATRLRFELLGLVCILALLLYVMHGWQDRVRQDPSAAEEKPEIEQPESEEIAATQVAIFLRELPRETPATPEATVPESREAEVPEPTRERIPESAPPEAKQSTESLASYLPDEATVELGNRVTAGLGEGEFPTIVADYRRYLGFRQYAAELVDLGCAFFILDRTSGQLAWRINLDLGTLEPIGQLRGFSPRSRVIRQEDAVGSFISKARDRGAGSYEVIVLLPARIESYIVGALERRAAYLGHRVVDFGMFEGVYRREGGQLVLIVESGRLKSGANLDVGARIVFGGRS